MVALHTDDGLRVVKLPKGSAFPPQVLQPDIAPEQWKALDPKSLQFSSDGQALWGVAYPQIVEIRLNYAINDTQQR